MKENKLKIEKTFKCFVCGKEENSPYINVTIDRNWSPNTTLLRTEHNVCSNECSKKIFEEFLELLNKDDEATLRIEKEKRKRNE